ncbi:STAS domain-containing protein [Salipaludibacillus sp. CF4.18]|uniref:STAS domain-containing protein n=1 Tax=Salipaludibacillus sp. CF4.18 TaxID=3373081 RepID=UPI003EE5AFEB
MPNKYNLTTNDFQSLKNVSKKMFELISEKLNVNTTYVTKRGESAMTVLSSFNKEEKIIPEGYSVKYGDTYCRLIIMNDEDAMYTENLSEDALTKELEVTSLLGVKGFLGVTLKDTNGNVFGTLCVMDREEKQFTEDDKKYLKTIAGILSHLIELDRTKYNLGFLSVPIIPITKGVSILSVQGVIDEVRSELIIQEVLNYGAEHQIEHFIIDLSGLVILENAFPSVLFDMVQALEIMGISTVITGVSPSFAKQEVNNTQLKNLNTKTVKTIESALDNIGFKLTAK